MRRPATTKRTLRSKLSCLMKGVPTSPAPVSPTPLQWWRTKCAVPTPRTCTPATAVGLRTTPRNTEPSPTQLTTIPRASAPAPPPSPASTRWTTPTPKTSRTRTTPGGATRRWPNTKRTSWRATWWRSKTKTSASSRARLQWATSSYTSRASSSCTWNSF